MKTKITTLVFTILLVLFTASTLTVALAANSVNDAYAEFLIKSYTFTHNDLEAEVRLYSKQTGAKPVILYVTGHTNERIGTVSDEALIGEYLDAGYHVVVADFGNDPGAVSPYIDESVFALRRTYDAAVDGNGIVTPGAAFEGTGISGELYGLYIVPSGCRLKRDVVYWEIDKHASLGTKEKIMEWWNEFVAGNPKWGNKPQVTDAAQMTKPDGSPLEYRLFMDITYPAEPKRDTPVMMMQASNNPRNRVLETDGRYHYIGFMLRGYTFVNYEHNYNPLARQDHYGYNDKGYTLDDHNGVKSNTAAVRCVRNMAERYGFGITGIGAWGHSKASYGPAILADPNNATRPEFFRYNAFPDETYGPQPFAGFSSKIDASYQSMGNGTRRHAKLVTPDNVPTIIACGDQDEYGAWEYWPDLKATYEKYNIPHLAFGMLGFGHTYASGFDNEMQIDRYGAVFDFFDRYLHLSDTVRPKLMYASPSNKSELVSCNAEIKLRFAPAVSETDVSSGVTICENGQPIHGSFTASQRGSVFTFIPAASLKPGTRYEIRVADTFAEPSVSVFKTASNDAVRLIAADDTYIGYGDLGGTSADKPMGGAGGTMAVRWWSNGGNAGRQWGRKALMRFKREQINRVLDARLNFTVAEPVNGSVFSIYGIIGNHIAFDEDTVTWNNAPGHDPDSAGVRNELVYGGAPIATVEINAIRRYTVDVTDYLQSLSGNDASFLLIRDRSAKGNDNIITKEGAAEINSPDCAPYLALTLETADLNVSDDRVLASQTKVSVPVGFTVGQLKAAVTVAGGGSFEIFVDPNKATVAADGDTLTNGYVLSATSARENVKVDYTVAVRTSVAKPTAGPAKIYDGKPKTADIPTDARYTITNAPATDAGTYTAVATLNDIMCYEWEDGTHVPVEISWSIAKATVDCSAISLENGTFMFDGTEKSISISGALPKGVRVEYEGNGQTEAGTYTVTARFVITDAANYEAGELPTLTATLTILGGESRGCGSLVGTSGLFFAMGAVACAAVFVRKRRKGKS